jgi:hypothetical protein
MKKSLVIIAFGLLNFFGAHAADNGPYEALIEFPDDPQGYGDVALTFHNQEQLSYFRELWSKEGALVLLSWGGLLGALCTGIFPALQYCVFYPDPNDGEPCGVATSVGATMGSIFTLAALSPSIFQPYFYIKDINKRNKERASHQDLFAVLSEAMKCPSSAMSESDPLYRGKLADLLIAYNTHGRDKFLSIPVFAERIREALKAGYFTPLEQVNALLAKDGIEISSDKALAFKIGIWAEEPSKNLVEKLIGLELAQIGANIGPIAKHVEELKEQRELNLEKARQEEAERKKNMEKANQNLGGVGGLA